MAAPDVNDVTSTFERLVELQRAAIGVNGGGQAIEATQQVCAGRALAL